MSFYVPPTGGNNGASSSQGNALGNFFKKLFTNTGTGKPGGNITYVDSPIPGIPDIPRAGFYQVKDGDTLHSVATGMNMDPAQLVGANAGVKTLPPTGSFIQTQNQPPPGYGPTNVQTTEGQPPVGYGPTNVQSTSGSVVEQSPTRGRGGFQYSNAGPIAQSQNVINTFNAMNENYRLTGQFDASALPSEISSATVKQMEAAGAFSNAVDAYGNPLTPAQALEAYGFTFQNGQFQRTGASGGSGGRGTPGQAGYNPSGNKGGWTLQRNQRGKLVWRLNRKQGGGDAPARPRPAAANVASTPSTTIDLNIGSG